MQASSSISTPRQAPLVESVVGFTFVRTTQAWDSIYFGKIHDRIQDEFPVVETLHGAEIVLGVAQANSLTVGAAPEMKRFQRNDGGIVVTVGPGNLGVSVLARKYTGGYPGWPTLSGTALRLLRIYVELTKPDAVQQVGVRYINSIDVSASDFRLDRYVAEASGIIPSSLLHERNPFSLRVDRTVEATTSHARRETINVVARPSENGAELILDVDELWIPGSHARSNDFAAVAEELHGAVGKVFVKILNQRFRRSLGLETSTKVI